MNYHPLAPRRVLEVREIYTVHYFEYTGSYAFAGEQHDFWELLYVDKGAVEVTAGERRRTLEQGQLIFHAPGEFHALSATGVAPDLVVVSFRCDAPEMAFFRSLVTTAGEGERSLLARIVAEGAAAFSTPLNNPETRALQRREAGPFGGEQLLAAALEELLIRLIRQGSVPAAGGRPPPEDGRGVEPVAGYQAPPLGQAPHPRHGWHQNHVGRSQLQKLFHTHTGGGVMEYFGALKIQAARRMIREGRLNFTQIAARLGFQSPHYFSRRFRQATGMSPSEYARSVKMLSELSGVNPDETANNG